MIQAVAFDIGETLVCDDRYWSSWADWLGVPRHTLSALVGAVVAQGRDNSEAVRLLRPDIDLVRYAPALLTELFRILQNATAGQRPEISRLLVSACRSADTVAYKLGVYAPRG